VRDFESGNDAWRATRKKQWAAIKQSLQWQRKCMGSAYLPNAKQLGAFQRYWLTGQSSERLPLAFRVWAHPEPSTDIVERFLRQTSKEEWGWSRGFWYEIAMADPRLPAIDLFGRSKNVLRGLFGPLQESSVKLADGAVAVRTPLKFRRWWEGVSQWLRLRVSNANYCLPDYSDAMWNLAPDHYQGVSGLYGVLYQAAHFIEPRGLKGADTRQKRFAEAFAADLESRDLPRYLRVLWEQLKTRKGRAFRWESEIGSSDYPDLDGYEVVVSHGAEVGETVIRRAGAVFEGLGLGIPDLAGIQAVEVAQAISRPLAEELGYGAGVPIPARRLRIRTNPDFTDSEIAEIHVDVIAPIPNPARPVPGTAPTLLLVPRPKESYVQGSAYGYEFNYRLVQRTFTDETGITLKPYVTMDEWEGNERTAERFWGPCYKADYQPLKVGRNALLDDPERDFPPWDGEPLAALGS